MLSCVCCWLKRQEQSTRSSASCSTLVSAWHTAPSAAFKMQGCCDQTANRSTGWLFASSWHMGSVMPFLPDQVRKFEAFPQRTQLLHLLNSSSLKMPWYGRALMVRCADALSLPFTSAPRNYHSAVPASTRVWHLSMRSELAAFVSVNWLQSSSIENSRPPLLDTATRSITRPRSSHCYRTWRAK